MTLKEENIGRSEDRIKPSRLAEIRAVKLQEQIKSAKIHFGLCGVDTEIEHFEILKDNVWFRKVKNPPNIANIEQATNHEFSDFMGIGRFSEGVQAEIAIDQKYVNNFTDAFYFGHNLVALLKLRGYSRLFCPVAASQSWDIIQAFSDNSVDFFLLDDIAVIIQCEDSHLKIDEPDLNWVSNHWDNLLIQYRNSRRFLLAFDIAYMWNHTKSDRLALINIWIGIEALFGRQNNSPVTKNLCERILNWLPEYRYEIVERLYNMRCNAVHGRFFDTQEMLEAIKLSYTILQNSLVKCIESNSAPLPDWNN